MLVLYLEDSSFLFLRFSNDIVFKNIGIGLGGQNFHMDRFFFGTIFRMAFFYNILTRIDPSNRGGVRLSSKVVNFKRIAAFKRSGKDFGAYHGLKCKGPGSEIFTIPLWLVATQHKKKGA